jgi:hypothetical protein
MKSLLQFFIFLIFITSTSLSQNLKITHYDLNLELFPKQEKLNAESIVTIKSLDSSSVNTLNFNLDYDKIDLVSDLHGNKYDFKKDGDKLIIYLNKPIKQKDSIAIRINYQAKFSDWASSRIMLLSGSEFYPQLENQNFSDKATFNTKVTVPDSLTVFSSGNLIAVDTLKDKLTYHYKTPEAIILFSVCAAVYSVHEQTRDNINIETFLFPEHKEKSDTLINYVGKILSFYQERFGKFPLPDFKIVEIATGANGMSGYSPKGQMLLSSSIINDIDDIGRFVIAHEVAHQWFPNKITFDDHDWYLNESFAQYAASSYCRTILKMYDKDINISKKYLFLSFGIEGNFGDFFRLIYGSVYEERPISGITYKDGSLYAWAGYLKGYYFLSSLAFTMGINTFDNAIKNLIENDKKDSISQNDFTKYLEDESGKDISSQVNDWVNTNKIIDYDICNVKSEKTTSGDYKTTVQIKNNGDMFVPFQVMAVTNSNKKIMQKVDTLQNDKTKVEFHSNEKIIKTEIDPNWYLLDANRINNYYPRQSKISFLISDLNLSEEQYFYYPSFTYSKRDNFRLGLWFSNIYPIMPDILSRNLELIKWRTGLFYGFGTKRTGYYLDFKTILGMPSYRWNWGMNLSNYRGTEDYGLNLNYIFQKDERYGKHNILTLTINRNLIYDIAYYDNEDFQHGANNTLSLNWDKKLQSEKENITAKFGSKMMGGDFSYSRISMELENFLPASIDWLNYRLFGGIVRGNYPTQESVFLSGSVYPSSFAYWFVDPGNSISTQRNLHVQGDANLRGFIGQHLRGLNGLGANLEVSIPNLKFVNMFCDVGNVWNKSFGSLKYDLGIGLNLLGYIKIDFPLYINQPVNNGKKFDFRWLLEFNF